MRNFEDLEVWQLAHTLTVELYRLTKSFPRDEVFGLTSQIRRACGSIGANLAEGCGRWGEAELGRYVQIAVGSANELHNHLRLGKDLGYVTESDYQITLSALTSIRKMLTSLLQALRRSQKLHADDPLAKSQGPKAKSHVTIGVLALQGDFDAHRRRLEELGAEVVLVRKVEQLNEVDGLVIPGGESSTFLKLLGENGFRKLSDFVHYKPTFGTCAGAILLAKQVENPHQTGLNAIDMTIRRNAYGRQIDSSIVQAMTALGGDPLEMVFIRAPRIEQIGDGVEVLAKRDGDPVLVRKGNVMAATFHPELSDDTRVHAEFLKLVKNGSN